MNDRRLVIRLTDGITFHADSTYDKFGVTWKRALARKQLIEMVNDKGLRRMVNPAQIIYVAEPTVAAVTHDQPATRKLQIRSNRE